MSKKPGKDSSGLPVAASTKPGTQNIVPFQWKPGDIVGPKDITKKRAAAMCLLLELLQGTDPAGRHVNAQRWLDAVLKSEYLMGKFLDKMMPTLTPEQINLFAGTFEQRVLQVNASDPSQPNDTPATPVEGPFEGPAAEIIEAIDPTPVVVKPQPARKQASA